MSAGGDGVRVGHQVTAADAFAQHNGIFTGGQSLMEIAARVGEDTEAQLLPQQCFGVGEMRQRAGRLQQRFRLGQPGGKNFGGVAVEHGGFNPVGQCQHLPANVLGPAECVAGVLQLGNGAAPSLDPVGSRLQQAQPGIFADMG